MVIDQESAPAVKGFRKPPKRLFDTPYVAVPRCPYCKRPHGHYLTPLDTADELVLPARCDLSRFYRVVISGE